MSKRIGFAFIFILVSIFPAVAQKHPAVSIKDFRNLVGCWQGILNYSGTMIRKPYATKAELVVKQIGRSNRFDFVHIYTKDPHDNVHDTITISNDGKKVRKEAIKSKRYNKKGNLEIITEDLGFDHDNNKPSLIRQVYTFGKGYYMYKKQVQLEGQTEWLDRQEFNYVRKPCRAK